MSNEPNQNSEQQPDPAAKPKPSHWRLTRRNFAAAGAVFAAGMMTRINRAMASRDRGRGGDDGGYGGGRGGVGRGGNGGGHGGGGNGGGGVRCFLAGTRIQTPSGEVDVASLCVGDLVTTHSGSARPIVRIETTVYPRLAGRCWPRDVLPVKVARDAFASGLPSRDLYLSSGHAVLAGGVLIPIGHLLNGTTIAEVTPDLDRLAYFQLELPAHDIIAAEGAPCESLLVAEKPCAELISNVNGAGSQLKSRLRSAVSPILDVRNRVDVIRDQLEDRAEQLAA